MARARGIQLTHVPDLAGVSRSHFWDVLAGRKSPTLAWLAKVALALQCEPYELLMDGAPQAPVQLIPRSSKRTVPLVSARAAAGAFSDPEAVEPSGYITTRTRRVIRPGMFAVTVSGRSMEPTIRDGDICLFKRANPREADGKIVLLQLRDARDPESGGRYTVKRFKVAARRDGRVARVRLEPLNKDYEPILLEDDPMRQLTVIAEFVEVLVQGAP